MVHNRSTCKRNALSNSDSKSDSDDSSELGFLVQ